MACYLSSNRIPCCNRMQNALKTTALPLFAPSLVSIARRWQEMYIGSCKNRKQQYFLCFYKNKKIKYIVAFGLEHKIFLFYKAFIHNKNICNEKCVGIQYSSETFQLTMLNIIWWEWIMDVLKANTRRVIDPYRQLFIMMLTFWEIGTCGQVHNVPATLFKGRVNMFTSK